MQHQKWDAKSGSYKPSVVYNTTTGEAVSCYPIDGRELVASGEWSHEPPAAERPDAATEAEAAAAPEPATTTTTPRRGRPPKH